MVKLKFGMGPSRPNKLDNRKLVSTTKRQWMTRRSCLFYWTPGFQPQMCLLSTTEAVVDKIE